jgi:diadenosine tetraphosphatase ApaH/serine/threonine PP2A family protein phosphatase
MQDVLTKESFIFLSNLPETVVTGQATLVHGSPRNPVWEYILDMHNARQNFEHFDTQICIVGHTHLPVAYTMDNGTNELHWMTPPEGERIELKTRAIVNPGSVGQPRDHDPRSSYAIFYPENNGWEIRRVAYDIKSVQKRIKAAALPARHALRLGEGW